MTCVISTFRRTVQCVSTYISGAEIFRMLGDTICSTKNKTCFTFFCPCTKPKHIITERRPAEWVSIYILRYLRTSHWAKIEMHIFNICLFWYEEFVLWFKHVCNSGQFSRRSPLIDLMKQAVFNMRVVTFDKSNPLSDWLRMYTLLKCDSKCNVECIFWVLSYSFFYNWILKTNRRWLGII